MRRIVWACVNTTGFRLRSTKVARSRLLLNNRFFLPRIFMIVGLRRERVEIDIPIGTIFRAETAADAPVFDDDFK